MHHGENWGELCDDNDAFARVYNNLLLHEYIYYFTTVYFNLLLLPFFYTVSQKNIPYVFSYNSQKEGSSQWHSVTPAESRTGSPKRCWLGWPAAERSHLKADRVLGELEDADEADDSEERQGRAGLGAGAAHCRKDVEQCHVVRHDRHHVHHVLEVLPEPQLRGARHEPDGYLDGKPGCTGAHTGTELQVVQMYGEENDVLKQTVMIFEE